MLQRRGEEAHPVEEPADEDIHQAKVGQFMAVKKSAKKFKGLRREKYMVRFFFAVVITSLLILLAMYFHGASYRRYGVLPRRSWLKINFCEIFGVVRFSTFATLSAKSGNRQFRADRMLSLRGLLQTQIN